MITKSTDPASASYQHMFNCSFLFHLNIISISFFLFWPLSAVSESVGFIGLQRLKPSPHTRWDFHVLQMEMRKERKKDEIYLWYLQLCFGISFCLVSIGEMLLYIMISYFSLDCKLNHLFSSCLARMIHQFKHYINEENCFKCIEKNAFSLLAGTFPPHLKIKQKYYTLTNYCCRNYCNILWTMASLTFFQRYYRCHLLLGFK